ncbi:MAG: sigma-54 dependent transcriptional regulator [Planctomycetota bacterium]|nr:sigma-54 dependent transcriptional regulator [Planctomycetota bacterium]
MDSSLDMELRNGLNGLQEVENERRFEVLAGLLLGALLKRFQSRCVSLHLISAPDPEGNRQVEEIQVRSVGGQRPSGTIDSDLLESLGSLEAPQLIQGVGSDALAPILSYSIPLISGERALFVIEGDPAVGFGKAAAASLREMIDEVLFDIVDIFLISRQAKLVATLESRVERLEEVMVQHDLEIHLVDHEPIKQQLIPSYAVGEISTVVPEMVEVLKQVERLRDTDLNVLIRGETGTGKEVVARAFHQDSSRSSKVFEVISCASLAPGLIEGELFGWRKGAFSGADEDRTGIFESANGGTVLLDEVGELPLEIQQKLLRVLQEGALRPVGGTELVTVDVRVLASTRYDLLEMVSQGKFREDLYYRLAGFVLELPPLRERAADIPLLLKRFVSELDESPEQSMRFSESAVNELVVHPWPGNIQQLKNVIQQAILTCKGRVVPRKLVQQYLDGSTTERLQGDKVQSTQDEIMLRIPATEGFNDIVSEVERLVILTALRRNRGNKSRVTKQLKIPRQTLYNKIDRYCIDESEYK